MQENFQCGPRPWLQILVSVDEKFISSSCAKRSTSAIKYWNMPEGHQTMRDLLLYIRADEAKHREVNHTLGNLDQKNDPNPFVSDYKDPNLDRPSKDIAHIKSTGWERKDII